MTIECVHVAADRWAQQQRRHLQLGRTQYSRAHFFFVAKKWLRFLGRLEAPATSDLRFGGELADFARFIADQKGSSNQTVTPIRGLLRSFLPG